MTSALRRFAALIVGALVLCAPLSAAAAPGDPTAEITVVKSDSSGVEFVLSAEGLPSGARLNLGSLKVSADGAALRASGAQDATTTKADALPPRATVLVMDTSGSMAGDGMTAALAAARLYASSLPSDVQVGLVTFATEPRIVVAPTRNRAAVLAAISGLVADGDTALYDGIVTAAGAMDKLPAATQKRLVVLSDGRDTSSTNSLASSINVVKQQRIPTDVVAFRLPEGDQAALDQIAAASRGRVIPVTNANQLAGAFNTVAQNFTERVLVAAALPEGFAGREITLSASVEAGTAVITATTLLRIPAKQGVEEEAPPEAARSFDAEPVSGFMLWMVLLLAFLGILGVAFLLFLQPVLVGGKSQRLADLQPYRLRAAHEAAQAAAARTTPEEGQVAKAALSVVDKVVRSRGLREQIVQELDRAGLRLRPEEWALLRVGIALALGAVLTLVLGSLPAGLVLGALLGWITTRLYLAIKTDKRCVAFGDQLPDVLQLVAGSLRSGFSLGQSLDAVVREGSEPAAPEFGRALTQARIGMDLEDALDRVADRMKSADLTWVVMAIRIQRQVGGNLAEVLMNTVATLRERASLRRQARSLSAEGRLSGWILICLPIFVASMVQMARPEYLKPLYSSVTGFIMLGIAITLEILGAIWIRAVSKIEV